MYCKFPLSVYLSLLLWRTTSRNQTNAQVTLRKTNLHRPGESLSLSRSFFPFHSLLVRSTLKWTANDPKLTHWAWIISFAWYRFGDSLPSSCSPIQIERRVTTNAKRLTLIWLNDRFRCLFMLSTSPSSQSFWWSMCLCVQVYSFVLVLGKHSPLPKPARSTSIRSGRWAGVSDQCNRGTDWLWFKWMFSKWPLQARSIVCICWTTDWFINDSLMWPVISHGRAVALNSWRIAQSKQIADKRVERESK